MASETTKKSKKKKVTKDASVSSPPGLSTFSVLKKSQEEWRSENKLRAAHSFLSNISLGPDDPLLSNDTFKTNPLVEVAYQVAESFAQKTSKAKPKKRSSSINSSPTSNKSGSRKRAEAFLTNLPLGNERNDDTNSTGSDVATNGSITGDLKELGDYEMTRSRARSSTDIEDEESSDTITPSGVLSPPTNSTDVVFDGPLPSGRSRSSTHDTVEGGAELDVPTMSSSGLLADIGRRKTFAALNFGKMLFVDHLSKEHFQKVAFDSLPARLFYATRRLTSLSFPFAVTSVIRFDEERTRRKRRQATSNEMDLLQNQSRNQVISYEALLKGDDQTPENYDPNYLDDPELRTGTHPITLLPFIRLSIIPFVKPADLRKELNDQFRQKHSNLDAAITLSKIRRLKQQLIDIAFQPSLDLEASTVALAFIYMERLILKNVLKKSNRRVLAGACLVLAAKINDPLFVKNGKVQNLMMAIEEHMKAPVTVRDLRLAEFSVFAALNFDLHASVDQILPHFNRIINTQRFSNVQEYLGEKMYLHFFSNPQTEMP